VQQAIFALGVLGSLVGLGLILRYGVTFYSRIDFGMASAMSAEALRMHGRDLRGRFGFLLVVAGAVLQVGAAYCVWMP
jgi:hypothetical protein